MIILKIVKKRYISNDTLIAIVILSYNIYNQKIFHKKKL